MTSDAMEPKSITISVVIPAYNAANHIRGAIDSILAQTRQVDEIIVVDDGSTDATPDIAQSYGGKVAYIHQQNASAGATRNAGIRAARSEWIAFLDSDDEWVPEKIQLQTELIERNSDISWAYSNCYLQRQSKESRTVMLDEQKARLRMGEVDCFENYLQGHAEGFPAWTGTVIAKKQAIIKVGMFNPQLSLAQDIDLWFRLTYQFPKVGFIPAPLAIYNTETPESNVKRFTETSHICKVIDGHIKLSTENDCLELFRGCIFTMVNHWVLLLSREERYKEMLALINKYRQYLPAEYYVRKSLRGLFPWPVGCYNKMMGCLRKRS